MLPFISSCDLIWSTTISLDPSVENNVDDCFVMASVGSYHLDGHQVIYCKVGDREWSVIEDGEERDLVDLTYCDGLFYGNDGACEAIVECNIGSFPGVRAVASLPIPRSYEDLVESCGELLLVLQRFNTSDQLLGFEILRLRKNMGKWLKVKSLGDRSLFLSHKSSLSVLASDYPGLKRNCIYFITYTDDGLCCGVFNIGDGSIKYLSTDVKCSSSIDDLWIIPSVILSQSKPCHPPLDPSSMMVKWSALPEEMLDVIASRVHSNCVVDYVRFGAVCKPWRSLFVRKKTTDLPPPMPLLMVSGGGFSTDRKSRSFYDIVGDNVNHLERSLLNPSRCHGCGHGWLIVSDNYNGVYLENPITRKKISLPALTTLPFMTSCDLIWSAAISLDPSVNNNVDDCFFMASVGAYQLDGHQVIYCTVGNREWNVIEDDEERDLVNLTYCGGLFYANDGACEAIVECNFGSFPGIRPVASLPTPRSYEDLVDSCGELLLVRRRFDSTDQLLGFEISRLRKNMGKWLKVKSLGDRSLFLSHKSSLSILASDHPGLKQNCIYFITYSPTLMMDFVVAFST
ncbi:hypothetical protein GIB67_016981 [Kingdonia uniflora]|uniref:KIB1-4 beta-propeller domain-containing protein n=1 Tax=Kingdonia uniflora TaxID=39325 RepID=A0A7J7M3J3_9MAGN|nr:hypothetical protein GIB67_016981 [Kingdonia uniflora]